MVKISRSVAITDLIVTRAASTVAELLVSIFCSNSLFLFASLRFYTLHSCHICLIIP